MNLQADEFSLYQKLFDIINPQLPSPTYSYSSTRP